MASKPHLPVCQLIIMQNTLMQCQTVVLMASELIGSVCPYMFCLDVKDGLHPIFYSMPQIALSAA